MDATLTLRPVSAVTTTFSDRPRRDSGAITTAEFVSTFDQAYGDSLPNAIVSSLERGRGEFPVELSDPRYEEATRTLTYAVRPIGVGGLDLPGRIGPVSVFIDTTDIDLHLTDESDEGGGFFVVVSGRVVDETGNGVAGATVMVGDAGATTDDSGDYEIAGNLDLDPGSKGLATVTAQGYRDLSETVTLSSDFEAGLNFTLEQADPDGGS